jgi:hypothetical protein
MRDFLTRVHLCIKKGGGHLHDIVHREWNYVKKKKIKHHSKLWCAKIDINYFQ